jgi:serine/threonine-protein phosphatase 2A regulatory subunit A
LTEDVIKSTNSETRVDAVKKLRTVALAMGNQRVRKELIPFLKDIMDSDDEVLHALARELGNFVDVVGGAEHASCLLPYLEKLCEAEETVVRGEAVKSLVVVGSALTAQSITEHFEPMVKRLSQGDWFTSHISACGLFATAYKHSTSAQRTELRQLFVGMCKNEMPMVRAAAFQHMGTFAGVVEEVHLDAEILPEFLRLAADDSEAVRVHVVDNALKLCSAFPADKVTRDILPVIVTFPEDKLWKIRCAFALKYDEFAKILGRDVVTKQLLPLYVKLLSDSECEVRAEAVLVVPDVAVYSDGATLSKDVMPILKEHVFDQSTSVRQNLAAKINSLAPTLGKDKTASLLLPLLVDLLKDESPEVRQGVVATLEPVCEVMGQELAQSPVLNAILERAQDDKIWRVRLAVIEGMPVLCKALGKEFFDDKLKPIYTAGLVDQIYSIREACCGVIKGLTALFGPEWTMEKLVPAIKDIEKQKDNALTRTTVLHGITELTCVGGNVLSEQMLPTVLNYCRDPVANVRFEAAKTLSALVKVVDAGVVSERVVPVLKSMGEDADKDVKHFSSEALKKC